MRWLLIALAILGFVTFPSAAKAEEPLGCDQRLALDGYQPARAPEVIFIGVRGSGESPKLVEGLGRRSVLLYRSLKDSPQYKGRIVCTSALLGTYQAQAMPELKSPAGQWTTFVDEMMGSADALATPLLKMAAKFPDATFIISGFSKGAAVAELGVERAIEQDPSLASRIESLVLISSPLASNGIVSIAQRFASTPLRLALIKSAIAVLSSVHKVIPDHCLLVACHSVKAMSQHLDRYRSSLVASLQAVVDHKMASRNETLPITAVCKAGDVICSPLSGNSLPSLAIHNDWYQNHTGWISEVRIRVGRAGVEPAT